MHDIIVNRLPINHDALYAELQTALGAVFVEVIYDVTAGNADAILEEEATQAQCDQARAIVTEHDASILTPAQIKALEWLAIQEAAHDDALSVPDWATWTKAQFLTWYNANISDTQINAMTNLADAKVVMKKLSKAVHHVILLSLAERNQLWPDIQE